MTNEPASPTDTSSTPPTSNVSENTASQPSPYREHVTVELPVKLTEPEKAEKTDAYFALMTEIDEFAEETKAIVAQRKLDLKSKQVRAGKIRTAVRTGVLEMTVDAEQVYDHTEGQTWTEFDGVKYRERRMTSQEYLKGTPELFPSEPTGNSFLDDDEDENDLGIRVAVSEEGKVTRLDKRRSTKGSEDEPPLSDKDRDIRQAMREEKSPRTKKDHMA